MFNVQDTAERMSISAILNSPDQSADSRSSQQSTEQTTNPTVEPQRRAARLRSTIVSSDEPAAKRVKLSELLKVHTDLVDNDSEPRKANADPQINGLPKLGRGFRWTREEDDMLVKLRNVDKMPFEKIAIEMSRTTDVPRDYTIIAIKHRYGKLEVPEKFKVIGEKAFTQMKWTPQLDDQIIALSREGMSVPKIADAMGIDKGKMEYRHRVLRKQGKVTDNEHAANRRAAKESKNWTLEEEEVVARMWLAGADVDVIHKTAKLGGKCKSQILERKKILTDACNPNTMYRKLMIEYNTPGHAWTQEDVVNRKFETGS
jgi:hypothetical protein